MDKPNGKPQACLDLKELNNAMKRQHYSFLLKKNFFPEMRGANFFSIIDASKNIGKYKSMNNLQNLYPPQHFSGDSELNVYLLGFPVQEKSSKRILKK